MFMFLSLKEEIRANKHLDLVRYRIKKFLKEDYDDFKSLGIRGWQTSS